MLKNHRLLITLLPISLLFTGCSSSLPALTPTPTNEPIILVPIQIPKPADSAYTDEGFLFGTVANKLGFTLDVTTCEKGANLNYGYLLFDPQEPSCFHVNFLKMDFATYDEDDIHSFLVVTALRKNEGEEIKVGLALANVSINEKSYWGEAMLTWVPKLQKILGIPNQYFPEKTNIYALYPLTDEQAKILEPYRIDKP